MDGGARRSRYRRICAAGIGCALVIAGGCVAIGDRGRPAPAPGEVAFELVGPGGAAVAVPVRINGKGPYPFVLDTGATLTCVDDALARELDLRDAPGTVAFGGTIGTSGHIRVLQLDSVSLGDASVDDLHGCAVDLASMRRSGVDVRGLLGLNFLKAYRVTLDFEQRTIRVERASEHPRS